MLAVPRPAPCWDGYGHMLIAEIAYERLKPAARAQVDQLLAVLQSDPHVTGLEDKYKPYNAVTVAAWMDDMKPKRDETGPGYTRDFSSWHFVDLPDGKLTADDVRRGFSYDAQPNAYNVIVDRCEKTLADPTAATADRARMLGFFLHLAGDIHQPLHCIGRLRGGNSYAIDPLPQFDPTWKIDNLHAFWDTAYRYDAANGQVTIVCSDLEMPRTMQPGQGELKRQADALIEKYVPRHLKRGDPADWAVESHDVATDFAFPAGSPSTLSPDYIHQTHVIACRRMALAGCRIADVLNTLLK
jgi:hypothetical protein